jgi:C-terminal processing protease CtpA/Prc
MDYDYSKAYGGGGADSSVVSSVGGTLGSQTQATGAGAGMVEGSYSEDASFDAAYQDPNTGVKEVALDVWAPPGKLGVVIDTPNDGAPVVHAIKDSSVIADKLQVGDKLIAVDDENVEEMTAIKVSKLISRKSANATRKLSIVRQVVE